ncbi:MAG: prenyltransferase/squalene oxidase repeat-containing protein [Planctomycetota bacterium]
MNKSRLHWRLLLGIGAFIFVAPLSANEALCEGAPEVDAAVSKGLEHLVKSMRPDGSYSINGQYTMSMTALSGLAYLSAGHTPDRGAYRKEVSKILSFIMKQCQNPAFKNSGFITTANEGQPMYGHGFAVLFLSQVYGTVSDPSQSQEIKAVIRKGVALITRAQSRDGGWYYTHNSQADEGSVTVTQLQALRAAQNAGVLVNENVIAQAKNYLKKSQNRDGGIRYRAGNMSESTEALTAAGIACYFNCGDYSGEHITQAIAFLDSRMMRDDNSVTLRRGHFMYTHQYASQAYFALGGDRWRRYYKVMATHLVQSQMQDGSWQGDIGSAYATPVGIMILTLPYRQLPINQR